MDFISPKIYIYLKINKYILGKSIPNKYILGKSIPPYTKAFSFLIIRSKSSITKSQLKAQQSWYLTGKMS